MRFKLISCLYSELPEAGPKGTRKRAVVLKQPTDRALKEHERRRPGLAAEEEEKLNGMGPITH